MKRPKRANRYILTLWKSREYVLVLWSIHILKTGHLQQLKKEAKVVNYNRRQNELRHFALDELFDVFRTSKGEKIAFLPPSSLYNVVPLFNLPLENKKHPNFEWRGQGRGVDSYVLWGYPIWVQCLNNFVADCRFVKRIPFVTRRYTKGVHLLS